MKSLLNTSLKTRNKVGPVAAEDQLQLMEHLPVVEALARLTYESIYVIDYERMAFDYVSPNPLFLCGYTVDEVMAMGYDFYFRNVPEKDLELLNILNEAGFDFYDKIPLSERKLYSIAYDFHLTDKSGKQTLVNHKLTPLFFTGSGQMWKSICIVSISHQKEAGNVTIFKQGSGDVWHLDLLTRYWHKSSKPGLTEREIEVLRLYARGLTISEIAEKLFVVPDTVKYYRRKIFENFGVSNIVEALAYAVHHKII